MSTYQVQDSRFISFIIKMIVETGTKNNISQLDS